MKQRYMPTSKHDDASAAKTQADKFRDLARELECDEDEGAFEETVKRVAKGGGPAEAEPPKRQD
jgi:hypothetical protein